MNLLVDNSKKTVIRPVTINALSAARAHVKTVLRHDGPKQLIAIENYADAPQVDLCREWTEFHNQLATADKVLEKVIDGINVVILVLNTTKRCLEVLKKGSLSKRRTSL